MRIYVGNLSYDTTEDELRKDFAAFGEVVSVSVVTDRYSGRSKGFAFVEMTNKAEADAAIAGLNGKAVKERTLVVKRWIWWRRIRWRKRRRRTWWLRWRWWIW